jgi:hypothetical protein
LIAPISIGEVFSREAERLAGRAPREQVHGSFELGPVHRRNIIFMNLPRYVLGVVAKCRARVLVELVEVVRWEACFRQSQRESAGPSEEFDVQGVDGLL